jgi:hypothetical protein
MLNRFQSGIWKSWDCPQGQPYWAPTTFRYDKDCPYCKFGTIGKKVCNDCGKEPIHFFPTSSWIGKATSEPKPEPEIFTPPQLVPNDSPWPRYPTWPEYVLVKDNGRGLILREWEDKIEVRLLEREETIYLLKSFKVTQI